MQRTGRLSILAAGLLLAVGCGGETGGANTGEPALGPHDGDGLAATDLDRLAVGDPAPDFTLPTFDGDTVTLSDYRGEKTVLLVFYRGHW